MKLIIFILGVFLTSCESCETVCVNWEDSLTGKKCIEWENYVSICTGLDSHGNLKTSTCTKSRCSLRIPCRKCLSRMNKGDAPPEGVPQIPADRCY